MPDRSLIFLLCFFSNMVFAGDKEKSQDSLVEHDLELFEFLAMYEKDDGVFIDAEIDERTVMVEKITNQHVNTSDSNEE